MKYSCLALAIMALAGAPAYAQSTEVTGEVEYTDFNDGMGHRLVGSAWLDLDLGETAVVTKVSAGERDFGDESHSGVEGEIAVYHDWNDILSTRTSASLASDDVVFAQRSIEHDFNFKVMPKTVLLAGIKHVEYDGGLDALVLSAGVTRYFKGGFISYRFNRYDLDGLGNTRSHLVSVRFNDGGDSKGSTQIWLGRGTALQEVDFAATPFRGHSTGVSLRRVQPLGEKLNLNVAAGYTKFDTEFNDYSGVSLKAGLTLGF